MIIALKDNAFLGFYEDFYHFAQVTFEFQFLKSGQILLDRKAIPFFYDTKDFTKEEVVQDFIKEKYFMKFCKNRQYSVYNIKNKII